MIQSAVNAANDLWREQQGVEDAVTNLNKALSYGTPKVKNHFEIEPNIYPMFCRLFLTKLAFLWGKL